MRIIATALVALGILALPVTNADAHRRYYHHGHHYSGPNVLISPGFFRPLCRPKLWLQSLLLSRPLLLARWELLGLPPFGIALTGVTATTIPGTEQADDQLQASGIDKNGAERAPLKG